MTDLNELGEALYTSLLNIVKDCNGRHVDFKEMSRVLTELMAKHHPKWNWTVLCGDQYDVSTDGRKMRDIMLCKTIEGVKVMVLRGSPLERYIGGPANICVVRNKLGKSDTDAIKAAVEYSAGDCGRMTELIRKHLKAAYPCENWIVIAGDDFALSQDYEQMPCLAFCATVGHISIIVVKAQNFNF